MAGGCMVLFLVLGLLGTITQYGKLWFKFSKNNKHKQHSKVEPGPEAGIHDTIQVEQGDVQATEESSEAAALKHQHEEEKTDDLQMKAYLTRALDALFPTVMLSKHSALQRATEELWYHHKLFSIFYVDGARLNPFKKNSHRSRSRTSHALPPLLQALQTATNVNFLLLAIAVLFRAWRIDNWDALLYSDAILILLLCSFMQAWVTLLTDWLFFELLAGPWHSTPHTAHFEALDPYIEHRVMAEDWIAADPNASPALITAVEEHAKRLQQLNAPSITGYCVQGCASISRCILYSHRYALPDSILQLYEDASKSDKLSQRLFDLSLFVMESRHADLRLRPSHQSLQLLAGDDIHTDGPLDDEGNVIPSKKHPLGAGRTHDSAGHGDWGQVSSVLLIIF